MKDKLMWRLIAMLMIAICSHAALAKTADSPIHINSLSEIKDLENGTIVKIDQLYRVGVFGGVVLATDKNNDIFVRVQCGADLEKDEKLTFNKFYDEYNASKNPDNFDVLTELKCEVYKPIPGQPIAAELKLTTNAESKVIGKKLSDIERLYVIPIEIDPKILNGGVKDTNKHLFNQIVKFSGTLGNNNSLTGCDYKINKPTTITTTKESTFVGFVHYDSSNGITLLINQEVKNTTFWLFTALPNIEEGGRIVISSPVNDNKIQNGKTATLTATPNEGYKFVRWTLNGKEVSTGATYTTPAVYCNIGYVAVFAKEDEAAEEYDITVTADHPELGSVSVSTSKAVAGASVTATATPTDGARFDGWYNGDQKVSGDAEYVFQVTEAVALQAHFVKTCKVTFDQSAGGVITVRCGETTLT